MPPSLAIAVLAAALNAAPPAPAAPVELDLRRLVRTEDGAARIAPEVEALAGQRVRAVGFMVQMEEPSPAAFYLAVRPVQADESGGGTADLPPGTLRVEVPWATGELPFVPGPVEVVGTLEVGRAEDSLGRVSWLRVVLERPAATRKPARRSPSPSRDGVHTRNGGESK